MHRNHAARFLLLTLFVAACLSAQSITSPATGSNLTGGQYYSFYWQQSVNAQGQQLYCVYFGTQGAYSGNYWNTCGWTTNGIGLAIPANGNFWLSVYYQAGPLGGTWATAAYTIVSGASLTAPVTGSTIGTSQTFSVSASGTYYVSVGTGGAGTTDIWNNVAQSGASFTVSGIPYANVHPTIYVRLSQNSVVRDYQYAAPANPETITHNYTGNNNNWTFTGFPNNVLYSNLEAQFRDSLGESHGTRIYFSVSDTGGSSPNSCAGYYDFPTATYGLLNDAGSSWATAGLNTHANLGNSRCNLSTDSLRVGTVGSPYNVFLADFPLTFVPTWTGTHTIQVQGMGGNASSSGWITVGSWVIDINQLSTNVGDSMTVVEDGTLAYDSFTGTPQLLPTAIHPIMSAAHRSLRLPSGKTAQIKRGDNMKVNLPESSVSIDGDLFAYKWKLHVKDVTLIRGGALEDTGFYEGAKYSAPDGWRIGAATFSDWRTGDREEYGTFTVSSRWKPGPFPLYLMNDSWKEPVPMGADTHENVAIAKAGNIFNNSVRQIVIGPAIPPDATKDQIHDLIGQWIADYDMRFLSPLQDGASLDSLEPTTELEKQVIESLRGVL